MRSPRGVAATVVLLLALPVTFIYQLLGGARGEFVIHVLLALGAGLMSFAVFDFRTPRWVVWIGCVSVGALAVIFLSQGLSEPIHSAKLADVVYRVLGQRLEGWLVDLFLVWCIGVLVTDSRGLTRALGVIALTIAAAVEIYANVLALQGTSLNAEGPALKALVLLPVIWLLLESRKSNSAIISRARPEER